MAESVFERYMMVEGDFERFMMVESDFERYMMVERRLEQSRMQLREVSLGAWGARISNFERIMTSKRGLLEAEQGAEQDCNREGTGKGSAPRHSGP